MYLCDIILFTKLRKKHKFETTLIWNFLESWRGEREITSKIKFQAILKKMGRSGSSGRKIKETNLARMLLSMEPEAKKSKNEWRVSCFWKFNIWIIQSKNPNLKKVCFLKLRTENECDNTVCVLHPVSRNCSQLYILNTTWSYF